MRLTDATALVLTLLLVGCAGTSVSVEEPVENEPCTLEEFVARSDALAARQSVEELTGYDPVTEWAVLYRTKRAVESPEAQVSDRHLFLHGITHLDVEQARAIGQFPGAKIFLPDLQVLTPEVAGALGARRCELYLPGLAHIDAEAARALVEARVYRVQLDGLKQLTPGAATELAKLDGSLDLRGLEQPSDEVLAILGTWHGWGEQVILRLGLTDPTPQQIRAFEACQGWGLAFDRIPSLTVAQARAFGRIKRPQISFNGIVELDDEVARVMADWRAKFLVLDRLASVSAEQRAWLERGSEALSLRSARTP